MSSKPLCIYHGNCADGFGAAWVVRKYFKELNKNALAAGANQYPQPDFHAGVYQTPPPSDIEGRNIIMVDFSYKRPVLLEMAAKADNILILDHHKTAQADLVDLPSNVSTVFDMERSGAMIAWNHFFPELPSPQLIAHIQDRDLWQFKLHGTREIQANIFSYQYDFEVWDELFTRDVSEMWTEGVAIERKHFKDINELLAVVQHTRIIGGFTVPVANLPYIHSSDAGHIMSKTAPFAACYWDVPAGRVFSLRSSPEGIDVSEVAKQYGGGGHKNAAGFTVPKDHPLARPE
jgi:oligoribonuclease NrnB/cAMP/cGMP phosphodiesterase (DHH superfamily)